MEYNAMMADGSATEQSDGNRADSSLDYFIGNRTRLLQTKLEVLASEIWSRLQIRSGNVARIEENKTSADQMLEQIGRLANYHFREQQEKTPFYRVLFDLEKERRQQDVECWRDVVLVMRDFLVAWEAHEQAKAKARLIDSV